MACSATLLMLPVEAISRLHTRESLGACAAHSVQCSNFIAAHPEIRWILNHGTPLQSEMWHPIARPHYRLPADLPPLVNTLKGIEASFEVSQDAWTLGEVRKLREGCEW